MYLDENALNFRFDCTKEQRNDTMDKGAGSLGAFHAGQWLTIADDYFLVQHGKNRDKTMTMLILEK